MTRRAVSSPRVNAILRTAGWFVSSAPTSGPPLTIRSAEARGTSHGSAGCRVVILVRAAGEPGTMGL